MVRRSRPARFRRLRSRRHRLRFGRAICISPTSLTIEFARSRPSTSHLHHRRPIHLRRCRGRGPGLQSGVERPTGISISPQGILYFADSVNNYVRMINLANRSHQRASPATGIWIGGRGRRQLVRAHVLSHSGPPWKPSGNVLILESNYIQRVTVAGRNDSRRRRKRYAGIRRRWRQPAQPLFSFPSLYSALRQTGTSSYPIPGIFACGEFTACDQHRRRHHHRG